MLLSHARAMAHTLIFRSSDPTTTYHKAAVVPEPDAEDWEPIQTDPNPQPAAPPEDCGCGPTTLEQDEDTDDSRRGSEGGSEEETG